MIAYKGFNSKLDCVLGHGVFHYEVGKTYKEDSAKCASTGFHCVEEPIEVLTWYSSPRDRYCMVEAAGDINEDGDDRISCTEMTIIKELTLEQIAMLECLWIQDHPERKCSNHVREDFGQAYKGGVVIVKGRNPKAQGETGSTLFLLREDRHHVVTEIGVFKVDNKEYNPGVTYNVLGRAVT